MGKQDIQTQIEKAFDPTTSNSKAVRLSEQDTEQFIDYVVDESAIFKNARVERMNSPKKTIHRIGIGEKVLYPDVMGTALDESKYATTQPKNPIQLVSKDVRGIAQIYDNELEDNIEKGSFKDHFMRMLTKQISNQLETVALYARTIPGVNATDLLQLFDGWTKKIKTNGVVLDASDTTKFADRYVDVEKLAALYKSVPPKFRGSLDSIYMPNDLMVDYEIKYNQILNNIEKKGLFGIPFSKTPILNTENPVAVAGGGNTTIATGGATSAQKNVTVGSVANFTVGDVVTLDLGGDKEFSSILLSIDTDNKILGLTDNLPYSYEAGTTVKEATLDGSDILITPNKNLIVGLERNITFELERSARMSCTYIVYTMRLDFATENELATGMGINFKVK